MLFKIDELPIMAESIGIVGKLKGLIYVETRVSSIYCKIGDLFYNIPIEDAVICKDVIKIKELPKDKYLDINNRDVYNKFGERLGVLKHLELGEDFRIESIAVDGFKVPGSSIKSISPNIIVDLSLEELKAKEWDKSLDKLMIEDKIEEVKVSMVKNDEEEITDEFESMVDKNVSNTGSDPLEEEKCVFEVPTEIKHFDTNIISKYEYLLKKKLEDTILIADERFIKGYCIDQRLIEKAITNNEIVKLIMAAEE